MSDWALRFERGLVKIKHVPKIGRLAVIVAVLTLIVVLVFRGCSHRIQKMEFQADLQKSDVFSEPNESGPHVTSRVEKSLKSITVKQQYDETVQRDAQTTSVEGVSGGFNRLAEMAMEPLIFTLSQIDTALTDEAFTPYLNVTGRIECEGSSSLSCREMSATFEALKVQVWLDYHVSVASVNFEDSGHFWVLMTQEGVDSNPMGEFSWQVSLPRHDLDEAEITLSMNVVGWVPLFSGYLQMALAKPVKSQLAVPQRGDVETGVKHQTSRSPVKEKSVLSMERKQ